MTKMNPQGRPTVFLNARRPLFSLHGCCFDPQVGALKQHLQGRRTMQTTIPGALNLGDPQTPPPPPPPLQLRGTRLLLVLVAVG